MSSQRYQYVPKGGAVEENSMLLQKVPSSSSSSSHQQQQPRKKMTSNPFKGLKSMTQSLFVVAPLLFLLTVAGGALFYLNRDDWSISTSIFYSAQALLGCMYGVPDTEDFTTQVFTLFFYVFGSTLLAGAVGAFATSVVDSVTKEERRRQQEFPSDLDLDGRIGVRDWLSFYGDNLLIWLGWYSNQEKFLTVGLAFVWLGVGIWFCMHHLQMDLLNAFYFSLGAMSAAGQAPPPCESISVDGSDGDVDCKIEDYTAIFMIVYLIIGVPLFTLSLGQFSLSVVERAVRAREKEMMMRPLTEEEFSYACSLNDKGESDEARGTIDFSEFIVCEMLRLKRVDVGEIQAIRELFTLIDYDDTGIISREKLAKAHLFFQNLNSEAVQCGQSFGNAEGEPISHGTFSGTSNNLDAFAAGSSAGNAGSNAAAPVLLDIRHVSAHRRLSLSSSGTFDSMPLGIPLSTPPPPPPVVSGISQKVASKFHDKVLKLRKQKSGENFQ